MFDKNVPISSKSGMTEKMKKMDVGDSFEIEEIQRTKIHQTAKQIKIKATTRKQNNGMVRVWRVE